MQFCCYFFQRAFGLAVCVCVYERALFARSFRAGTSRYSAEHVLVARAQITHNVTINLHTMAKSTDYKPIEID